MPIAGLLVVQAAILPRYAALVTPTFYTIGHDAVAAVVKAGRPRRCRRRATPNATATSIAHHPVGRWSLVNVQLRHPPLLFGGLDVSAGVAEPEPVGGAAVTRLVARAGEDVKVAVVEGDEVELLGGTQRPPGTGLPLES